MATKKINATSVTKEVKVVRTHKTMTEVKAGSSIGAKVQTKGLKVDVFDLTGKVTTTVTLPESLFGAKVNKPLMAQAVRVYLANQRTGTQSTKTRGEVDGSTRKIYRQKAQVVPVMAVSGLLSLSVEVSHMALGHMILLVIYHRKCVGLLSRLL